MQDDVKEVNDIGPNLIVEVHENKLEIELKAATDFNPDYIKKGALKYPNERAFCIFLGDGSNKEKIEKLLSDKDIEVVSRETFKDDGNNWIIGMIKPSKEYLINHAIPQ